MYVNVDRAKCTGLGICESIAPEHFEIGDDGALILLHDDVSAADVATIEDAVRSCPTAALRLAETRE
ncbi:MAG TPA: ferredoxin [Rugosimonospora sp.]|nr:ferredoxin [Rugosimonospora sp.]